MQELFLAEDSDRLKLMVLYSGEEDEKLRRAASGTLAMLTALHPPICKRIPQVVSARGGGSLVCPPPHVLGLAGGPLLYGTQGHGGARCCACPRC